MSVTYSTSAGERASKALYDLVLGARMWELWGTLGWNDIAQRYRRSLIGPLWLTLSMGVMIATIGAVYAILFQQPLRDYLPYLALGIIGWGLLSSMVLEACTVFVGSEGIIRQVRVPFSTHVFRMLWRNLIVLTHNLIIYVIVAIVFGINPGPKLLLIFPGLLLICLNGLWIGMLIGSLSARFRDLQLIIANIMHIFFYITPIVWKPEQFSQYPAVFNLNPLHHFLELIRMPLLGKAPLASSWASVAAVTVIGFAVMFVFFARFRNRIAYWV
jgi:ABC-2 type transport system permease protein/lipopolysaccharide transport system permease protein